MSGVSRNTTPELSSAPAPEAPVYQRLRVVLNYMSTMGKQMSGGESNAKLGLFNKIMSEMMREITEFPAPIVELYLKQFAGLVFWTASGEELEGVEFPPGFTASAPKELE